MKHTPLSAFDRHQKKIALDTVRNPLKAKFLGGMLVDEALTLLMTKHGLSKAHIARLTGYS